jgi:hypothetical protein
MAEPMNNSDVRCVYVIGTLDGSAVKIGVANDPEKRLRELQVGNHEELVLVETMWGKGDPRPLEAGIHERLSDFHIRGEWFAAYPTLPLLGIGTNFPFMERAFGKQTTQNVDPVAAKVAYEKSERRRINDKRQLARAKNHIWKLARKVRFLTKEVEALRQVSEPWQEVSTEAELDALEVSLIPDWLNS